MTKYEKEIYRIVNSSRDHMTAEQMFSALREVYPTVSLATIYNNLNRLGEEGLVGRISVEGSPERFDRAEKHDHLVCERCGRLADVSFDDLTASLRAQLGEDFSYYDLKVYYLCPQCRAEQCKTDEKGECE